MKSLMSSKASLDSELLLRCKKLIGAIIPDAQVILYGSRARGKARKDSDYDLLILVNGPVDWKLERTIADKLYDLELETGTLLSAQVIPLSTWNSPVYQAQPFRQNVMREGISI